MTRDRKRWRGTRCSPDAVLLSRELNATIKICQYLLVSNMS
jgi:hypothetical protein